MVGRLDALALALALLAGTMAVEDSHRLDAGAPDDGLVAAAPNVCEQDQASGDAVRDRRAAFDQTASIESGLIFTDTTDAPNSCVEE
jgi:hypothetical protein